MKTVAGTGVPENHKEGITMPDAMTVSENILVIHDYEPLTFNIWLFIMCAIFILYFVVSTVHNINKEKRLEEVQKLYKKEQDQYELKDI